jgi:predicted RNase H-like HicB family nuclease
MRFVVVLSPDQEADGYNVSVPALPGCFTQAETVEEGLDRARDAIATYLEGETPASLRAAGVDPSLIIDTVEVDTALPA